jgi:hypothetical protein
MARYEELVRPTLVDVGARSTPSGSEQAAESLANAFLSFSRTAGDLGAKLRAQAGAEAGQTAGAAGAPEFRKNFRALTAYGKAYNDAALRSYAIRSEIDLEENAARIEVEAGTDPGAFRSAMEEVQKATIGEAPEEARPLLADAFNQRMAAGLARIQSKLAIELKNEDRGLVDEQMSRLTSQIANLRAQDDPESHAQAAEAEVKLNFLIDGAVSDGTLSESEGRTVRAQIQYDTVSATVIERFKNEMDDPYGDPVQFIQDFKELNRSVDVLPPDQEAKLENALLAELRERNALRAMAESQMTDEATARHQAGNREATMELLAGRLTQRGLLDMIQEDRITPEIARTLLNELQSSASRPAKSDQKELFSVETNLLSIPEEEIAANPKLTWDDRSTLILKKREVEASWKGTQAAREAVDRIDRALGIAPGTNRNMLTDEEAAARDLALTDFYDRIDALPPEERQQALLTTSQDVVRTHLVSIAQRQLDRTRANLAEYKSRMGDPERLRGNERRAYDAEIARMERNITALEQKVRQ